MVRFLFFNVVRNDELLKENRAPEKDLQGKDFLGRGGTNGKGGNRGKRFALIKKGGSICKELSRPIYFW